jgi:hypothetical protein
MTDRRQVAVAPHFHLPGALADQLLVADAGGWRAPAEDDLAALVPTTVAREALDGLALLFVLPNHLRSSFWSMLEQSSDFDAFATELASFLTFKQLLLPERAVIESVLHARGGVFDARDVWAVVNMGDEPVSVGLPGVRLRLGAGEGCRMPAGIESEVQPPSGDVPDVLLLVRRPS